MCKIDCTLGYKNHKSCKILPKFLPTLHFLQESYKFVRKSQFLQDWYKAQYFLQNSCKNFAKFAYFIQKFLQNLRFSILIISTKNSFKFFFRSDYVSLSEILGFVAFARTGMQFFLDLISFRSYSRFEILDFLAVARMGMQFFRSHFFNILFREGE